MKTKKGPYRLGRSENRETFLLGMREGFPIGLGYFVVAFSFGIAARNAGMTPFQSFLTSFLCNTSAGEYAGFALIAADASLLEVAVMTLVVNARYLLMSAAIGQRVSPGTPFIHRLCMVYDLTDEIFAVSVARPGFLNPNYIYGVTLVAIPFWAVGTALGCLAGNLMSPRLTSVLSVALFGMFLAVVIPKARNSRIIAGVTVISFAASYAAARLPVGAAVSDGTRTIILTITISAGAALLFPQRKEGEKLV